MVKSVCVHFLFFSWIYSFLSGFLEKAVHSKLNENVSLKTLFQLVKGGVQIHPLHC